MKNSEYHKKRKFLNMPKYPGGTEAFRAFIAENLRYPDEALKANIEGRVMVGYDVKDTGEVENVHVLKSLGYGCDDEALRLIGLLVFEKVKNRGVRLKMSTKTTINFRIPGIKITYESKTTVDDVDKHAEGMQKPEAVKYEYTISF